MTPKEIMEGVIDLFSDQSKWTQDSYALGEFEDCDGHVYAEECSSHDDEATCFCLMGAVDRISGCSVFQGDLVDQETRYPEEVVVADAMIAELKARGLHYKPRHSELRYEPIAVWNDNPTRTIDEVREFCGAVLKRLETA